MKWTKSLTILYWQEASFAHDTAYSVCKDLAKRALPDKILKHEACKIDMNLKHDGYQRGLADVVDKCLTRKQELEPW